MAKYIKPDPIIEDAPTRAKKAMSMEPAHKKRRYLLHRRVKAVFKMNVQKRIIHIPAKFLKDGDIRIPKFENTGNEPITPMMVRSAISELVTRYGYQIPYSLF